MTRTETIQIMAVMRAAYPGYYRDSTGVDAQAAAALWFEMLGHHPYPLVETAVKCRISSSKWPPTVADINEEILRITQPRQMDAAQAWDLVRRAVSDSGYQSQAAFDRLPEDIRQIVGRPSPLYQWGQMDAGTINSVVASNFQKAYRERAEKRRALELLPPAIRRQILGESAALSEEKQEYLGNGGWGE